VAAVFGRSSSNLKCSLVHTSDNEDYGQANNTQRFIQTLWLGGIASIGSADDGVWGLCPQRGPGAEPLVRESGGAPEGGSFFAA